MVVHFELTKKQKEIVFYQLRTAIEKYRMRTPGVIFAQIGEYVHEDHLDLPESSFISKAEIECKAAFIEHKTAQKIINILKADGYNDY